LDQHFLKVEKVEERLKKGRRKVEDDGRENDNIINKKSILF